MNITFTNKWLYTISSVLLLLFVFSVYAYNFIPNPGHGADTVWISVEGQEMSLQDAIDNGFMLPTCAENEILRFNVTGTNKWECSAEEEIDMTQCQICLQCNYDGGSSIGTQECVYFTDEWTAFTGDITSNGKPDKDNAACRVKVVC